MSSTPRRQTSRFAPALAASLTLHGLAARTVLWYPNEPPSEPGYPQAETDKLALIELLPAVPPMPRLPPATEPSDSKTTADEPTPTERMRPVMNSVDNPHHSGKARSLRPPNDTGPSQAEHVMPSPETKQPAKKQEPAAAPDTDTRADENLDVRPSVRHSKLSLNPRAAPIKAPAPRLRRGPRSANPDTSFPQLPHQTGDDRLHDQILAWLKEHGFRRRRDGSYTRTRRNKKTKFSDYRLRIYPDGGYKFEQNPMAKLVNKLAADAERLAHVDRKLRDQGISPGLEWKQEPEDTLDPEFEKLAEPGKPAMKSIQKLLFSVPLKFTSRRAQEQIHMTRLLRALRETQDIRDLLRLRADLHDLRVAYRAQVEQLNELFENSELSAEARKKALWQHWRDCPSTGRSQAKATPPDQQQTFAAAIEELQTQSQELRARCRPLIEAMIRRRLPVGHPDAFSARELAEYNRGRSTATGFWPYREPN